MTLDPASAEQQQLMRRLADDWQDSNDEEIELEFEDQQVDALSGGGDEERRAQRRAYFRELFRLQRELVKLQDWVAHTRQRVVVLFEGRDSAGKGGVIKRVTQRLNPRVCRVIALPAPNDRERTHWCERRSRSAAK
jgi:polyphosphate kinase